MFQGACSIADSILRGSGFYVTAPIYACVGLRLGSILLPSLFGACVSFC